MPNFVNAEHRRKWIASVRRAKRANAEKKRDVLATGAELGRKIPIPVLGEQPADRGLKSLNGQYDAVLNALRVERVRANDRVTELDRAIDSLAAIKQAAR